MDMKQGRHKGDNNLHAGKLSGGWCYEGSMGDAGQAIVIVDFKDDVAEKSTLLI